MVFLSQTLHSIYERICSGSIFFVIVATPCFFLLFPLQGKSQDVQDYQRVRSFSFTDSTTHVGILLRREEEKSRILFEDGTDTTISHESILYAEILRRAPLVVRTDDSTEVTGTLDGVTDDQIRFKTLQFIFSVIDPLMNHFWELHAANCIEEGLYSDEHKDLYRTLAFWEIDFLVPDAFKHYHENALS